MYIVVDFDGTCVKHSYPDLGEEIGAPRVLRKLVEKGHHLILFTMRCDNQPDVHFDNGFKMTGGDYLTQAVNWFKSHGIPLFGVQTNPTQARWTTSPKAYGHLHIDDAALGCPLIYPSHDPNDFHVPGTHDRPWVDWEAVEQLLIEKGIL